jgi:hypothetical protein
MANDEAPDFHYPVKCPACRSTTAVLKSATLVAGYPEIIRVDLRCGACPHHWTLYTRHSDPPI